MATPNTREYVAVAEYHGEHYADGTKSLFRGQTVRLGDDHELVELRVVVPVADVSADTPEPGAPKAPTSGSKKSG